MTTSGNPDHADRLLKEREALMRETEQTTDERATVELDQQAQGRLSRMDAIQRQAMAQATQARRALRMTRIDAALKRIEEGEFGFCQDCGDPIEPARLSADPTILLCRDCMSG